MQQKKNNSIVWEIWTIHGPVLIYWYRSRNRNIDLWNSSITQECLEQISICKIVFFAFVFTLQNLRKKFPQKQPINITTWTLGAILQGIKYEGKALENYSKKMMTSISRNNWESSEVNHTFIIMTSTLVKKDQNNLCTIPPKSSEFFH